MKQNGSIVCRKAVGLVVGVMIRLYSATVSSMVWLSVLVTVVTTVRLKAVVHSRSRSYDSMTYDQLPWETTYSD